MKENPKPQNTSCDDVRLDISELTAKQVRSVIHCLNQAKELKEIESWIESVSDQEMEPLLLQFNSILKNEPQFLYALKEIYQDERNSGEFHNLLNKLFSNLDTPRKRNDFVQLLKNHSLWIRDFFTNSAYRINFANLTLLSGVRSFQRGIQEQYKTGNLKSLLQSIDQYHHAKDALSFQELFRFFSPVSNELIEKKVSAEKIAGFIDWLVTGNRLEVFSLAAESLDTKPISCFNQGKSVSDPLNVLLTELREISPEQAPGFFQKRVSSILLIGQGYCKIPAEIFSAAELLLRSTEEQTLVPFFNFIQPLLKDPTFVKLLSSNAFRDLSNKIAANNNGHLFQDLITLINWLQKNPVSEGNSAQLLDSIFDEFDADEIHSLIELLPEDSRFFKTVERMLQSLPKLKKTKGISKEKDWLAPFTKNTFTPVIESVSRMNDEKKIIPIIDRVIELFKTMLDQGRLGYRKIIPSRVSHSKSTNSQDWELTFWKNSVPADALNCSRLAIRMDFFHPTGITPDAYLENLNQLSLCFGDNRSFLSLTDLVSHLLTPDSGFQRFQQFSELQSDVMNFILSFDSDLALRTFDQVLKLNQSDLSQVRLALKASSKILSVTKDSLHVSVETRKLLAKYISEKDTYRSLLSQIHANEEKDFSINLLSVKLKQLVLTSLPPLFNEYCANLDPNSPDCELEADQVAIYKQSPEALANQMVSEYITSSQSWLHPLEFKTWKTTATIPKNVSTVEFHLNPLLKQFDKNPGAADGVFDFVKRNQKTGWQLLSFLKAKAHDFYVIPYIFQTAKFPEITHEFHQLIRLRIVSDLDKLELLAINADFKPFGLMKNFGMNFITEIATSWGDVPAAERPKLATAETLSMARASILHQHAKYDVDILQRVGSCDPRGKNRLGRWFQNRLCRGELSDIRARLFNLKFVLSVLDDPREMALLRDLFYSIYARNTDEQAGVFTNGVKDDLYTDYPVDLLKIIPKIARLGLLHQAGLSIAQDNIMATEAIVNILNQSANENKNEQLSKFLSTHTGHTFIRDVISLAMELDDVENKNISSLLESLSSIKNQEWLIFLLEIINQNPSLFSSYKPLLHELLQQKNFSKLTPEMIDLISRVSLDLKNPVLTKEASVLVKKLSSSQNELMTLIKLKLSINLSDEWLESLAKEENQKYRTQMATFVTGTTFDRFCDAYSDSVLADKTYNFLEKSNQNSGVLELLEECRRFLH